MPDHMLRHMLDHMPRHMPSYVSYHVPLRCYSEYHSPTEQIQPGAHTLYPGVQGLGHQLKLSPAMMYKRE